MNFGKFSLVDLKKSHWRILEHKLDLDPIGFQSMFTRKR
jgi:hypothetical protein